MTELASTVHYELHSNMLLGEISVKITLLYAKLGRSFIWVHSFHLGVYLGVYMFHFIFHLGMPFSFGYTYIILGIPFSFGYTFLIWV